MTESSLSSKRELLAILDRFNAVPVLVVGDLILDRYIWGAVDRISQEAPVPIVDVHRTEERLGGAGNVIRNLRNIGCPAQLCGFIGDDKDGQELLALAKELDISSDGIIVDRDKPTILKTRVIAQRQQILRVDRERRSPHSLPLREAMAAIVDAKIDQSKVVIISDYGKGVICDSLVRKLGEARRAGRLGFNTRPLVVDPHPVNYDIYQSICVAKPNRKEAEAASGVKITDLASASKAADILLKKWQAEMVVITLGEDGLLIQQAGQAAPLTRKTMAREVFDVSGAGDTVTALFSAAIAAGASPAVAGDLANIAAGIVVSEVGTVAVGSDQLRKEIERMAD